MPQTEKKNVQQDDEFEKMATTTKRMPRAHKHTLAEMNRCVFIARWNTAHDCIMEILRDEVPGSARERRIKLYDISLRLVMEALHSINRGEGRRDNKASHYFQLLQETLSASLALVKHEVALQKEQQEFPSLTETRMTNVSEKPDVLSPNEINLLNCIYELMKFGTPILDEMTGKQYDSFNKEERKRYQTARSEYSYFYRHLHSDEKLSK